MAGFTGADCMGLMARAARMAARQGRELIVEEDIYAAMENKVGAWGWRVGWLVGGVGRSWPWPRDGVPRVVLQGADR